MAVQCMFWGGGILQATVRLGAASLYLVRFGRGEAGKLGVSWTCSGAGVCSAIVE